MTFNTMTLFIIEPVTSVWTKPEHSILLSQNGKHYILCRGRLRVKFFGSGKATIPVIRFDQNDRLYLLWADTYENYTNSLDVYLRYSDNFGATWSNRFRVNPNTNGDQWMPDMDIDSDGNLHIVYYNAPSHGDFKPYYCFVNSTGENHDNPIFNPPIAIASEDTSGIFIRPGDYLTVRLDQYNIPHVVWTDGRNNELDIYYAFGIQFTSEPTSESTSKNAIGMKLEVFLIIGFVSIIVMGVLVFIRRRKTNV